MSYKLRFLYAAKAAHPAGAVFATLRLADFCLALTASQTLIRGSLAIVGSHKQHLTESLERGQSFILRADHQQSKASENKAIFIQFHERINTCSNRSGMGSDPG